MDITKFVKNETIYMIELTINNPYMIIEHHFLTLPNSSAILIVTSRSRLSGMIYSRFASFIKLFEIATAAISFIYSVISDKLCFKIPLKIPGKTNELLI